MSVATSPLLRSSRPDVSSDRLQVGLFVGILLVALVLRVGSAVWQVPAGLYTDETKYVLTAGESIERDEDEPTDYRNPSLFRHLLGLEFRALGIVDPRDASLGEAGLRYLMAQLFVGRLTVALLGTAAVGLIYVVGRQAFGPRTGLMASALLAVNFLHLHLSHFGLNDVPALFFLVASLVPAVQLAKRPGPGLAVASGVLAGLAASTKYNYGIVVLVPVILIAVRGIRRRDRVESTVHGALVFTGALLGFAIGMPEILWAAGEIVGGLIHQSRVGDGRWSGQLDEPSVVGYGRTLVHAFGVPGVLFAVAGLAMLLQRRSVLGIALLAPGLIYVGFMSTKVLFVARYSLLVVPFVCLFAAYALARVWVAASGGQPARGVSSSVARRVVALAAIAAAFLPPALLGLQLTLLETRADTRVAAEQWVLQHVPPGTSIAAQSYALPRVAEGQELRGDYSVTKFTSLVEPRQFTRLACSGHQYFLLSSFRYDRQRTVGRDGEETGYELLAHQGQLVETIWPGRSGGGAPLHIDDFGVPFWHVMQYERPGPTIKIYRIPPRAC